MDPRTEALYGVGAGALSILFLFAFIRVTNYVKRRYGWIEDEHGNIKRYSDGDDGQDNGTASDEIKQQITRLERKPNPGTSIGGGVMPDDLISALQAAQSEIERLEDRIEELEEE